MNEHTCREITCEQARDILLLTRSGEASQEQAASLQKHLQECESCRTAKIQMEAVLHTFEQTREHNIPRRTQIRQRMVNSVRRPAPRRQLIRRAVLAGAACIFLAVLPVCYFLHQRDSDVAVPASGNNYTETEAGTLKADLFDIVDAFCQDLQSLEYIEEVYGHESVSEDLGEVRSDVSSIRFLV